MSSHPTGQALQDAYEIRPDAHQLTHNSTDPSENSSTSVDYEPHPENSLPVSPEHERIVKAITNLYSGSASEEDMLVYADKAVYDDPLSYCDTRYKIAGQWYGKHFPPSIPPLPPPSFLRKKPSSSIRLPPPPRGSHSQQACSKRTNETNPLSSLPPRLGIPKLMASSRTLKTEIISDNPRSIVYKQQQEYRPRVLQVAKRVNSLITLTLDEEGKVRYHKDMWNEKDYSHEGLGKVLKTLNGDYLTKVTQPPESL